jgi:hypothetical protein
MDREKFRRARVLIVLVMVPLLAATGSPKPSSEHIRTGKDWLSWTPEQRFVFMDAWGAGYSEGKTSACIAAAQLFVPNEEITEVTKQASARCIDKTKSYSHSAEFYSQLITGFYMTCPKYEAAPVIYMMTLLSDDRIKSADQFCKEGVRTEF